MRSVVAAADVVCSNESYQPVGGSTADQACLYLSVNGGCAFV